MKGCHKIDFVRKTLTITAEFEKAMNEDIGGEEYELYRRLMNEIPGLTLVRRTHRTPKSYTSKSGEKSTCNPTKNLKYENMERFIDALPNCDEYRIQYDFLKGYAGYIQTNRYALVRRWFQKQFPLYRKNPMFYYLNSVEVVPASVIIAEAQTEEEMKKKAA